MITFPYHIDGVVVCQCKVILSLQSVRSSTISYQRAKHVTSDAIMTITMASSLFMYTLGVYNWLIDVYDVNIENSPGNWFMTTTDIDMSLQISL